MGAQAPPTTTGQRWYYRVTITPRMLADEHMLRGLIRIMQEALRANCDAGNPDPATHELYMLADMDEPTAAMRALGVTLQPRLYEDHVRDVLPQLLIIVPQR